MSPAVQDAIGDPALWAAGLRGRREARDAAAGALGAARATQKGESCDGPIAQERRSIRAKRSKKLRDLAGRQFFCRELLAFHR